MPSDNPSPETITEASRATLGGAGGRPHFPALAPKPGAARWLAPAAAVLFCLAFTLPWWNRYLGVTNDGWHYLGAQRIVSGEVPYRDFYLHIPPFHQLKLALVIGVLGESMIWPNVVGLVERLILAGVMVCWLARVFQPWQALAGTILALSFYLSVSTESLSSMVHEASLGGVLSGFCAAKALGARWRQSSLWAALAGSFAGCAFLTKQTTGLAVLASVPFFLALDAWFHGEAPGRGRSALARLGWFLLGWSVWVAGVLTWLGCRGGLPGFVDQVFQHGPSSKGPLMQTLARPFSMLFMDVYQVRYTFLGAAVLCAIVWATRLRNPGSDTGRARSAGVVVLACAFGGVAGGLALSRFGDYALRPFFRSLPWNVGIVAGFGLSILLFAATTRRVVRGDREKRTLQFWLILGMASVASYCGALSWANSPLMILPGLAVLPAYVLSTTAPRFSRFAVGVTGLALFGCATHFSWDKLSQPYAWARWVEPNVNLATERSANPILRGYRISAATKQFVDEVTRQIVLNSSSSEPVFIHPHIPIFYCLSSRRPATFAAIHYIDVCPDYIARDDAQRLLANPPAVIVNFRLTEQFLEMGERNFRGGRRSGQRDLLLAIERLTRSYRLVESLVTPISGETLEIWARPPRARATP